MLQSQTSTFPSLQASGFHHPAQPAPCPSHTHQIDTLLRPLILSISMFFTSCYTARKALRLARYPVVWLERASIALPTGFLLLLFTHQSQRAVVNSLRIPVEIKEGQIILPTPPSLIPGTTPAEISIKSLPQKQLPTVEYSPTFGASCWHATCSGCVTTEVETPK